MDEEINNDIQRQKTTASFYTAQHPVLNPHWPWFDLVFLERRMGNPSLHALNTYCHKRTHTLTQYVVYCCEVPSISDLLESFSMLFFNSYEKEQFLVSSCALYSAIVGLVFFATQCQVAFSWETILWCTGSGAFPRAARQRAHLIQKQCAEFCHNCSIDCMSP